MKPVAARVVDRFLVRMGASPESRKQELKKIYDEMKALKPKVDNADASAKKKFEKAYDKLYELGEEAVKAAKKLLPKLDEDGQQAFAGPLAEWDRNKRDHTKGRAEAAHEKLQQAQQTWGYATQIDQMAMDLTKG